MKRLFEKDSRQPGELLIRSFEHKEAEDDDCGLPENPIFSNYSKYLWKGHSENRRIRKNGRSPEKNDGNNRFQ